VYGWLGPTDRKELTVKLGPDAVSATGAQIYGRFPVGNRTRVKDSG
jgi:hypothetical protein